MEASDSLRGERRETGAPAATPVATEGTEPVVDLTQVAFALSDALDLVGAGLVQHGKRVAVMSAHVAEALDLPDGERDDLFLSALLHDCGVSRTSVHRALIRNFDWEGAPEHCRVGADLLRGFPPLRRHAEVVLLHHTPHSDPLLRSVPPRAARDANLVLIADRTDALLASSAGEDPLVAKERIRRSIAGRRGTTFAPPIVDAFLEASDPESFWLELEPHHLERELAERGGRPRPISGGDLRELAAMFARVVDAKSPFTAEHSAGVARLSELLGAEAGLSPQVCRRLELAGLLHDLGKLRVPDEILDKPARLDAREFALMERHSFETWQILRRIDALRDVASWAAWHHEQLSGAGYPFHRRDGEIPLPARIVAVADVFQALAQDRPYRAALAVPEIVRILREMAADGALDPGVVELAASRSADCWLAAVAGSGTAG
jgi:HD-GYP domain-containing protein (c-di-GMP phosphodiesterase class II)